MIPVVEHRHLWSDEALPTLEGSLETHDPRELTATQDSVALEHLIAHAYTDAEADQAIVVVFRGRKYILDGHHRWVVALLRSAPFPAWTVKTDERCICEHCERSTP